MPGSIDRAVRILARGGIVAYPTDTLVGLGARALDPRAVRRLVGLKGRSELQPISIAVASFAEIEPWSELTRPGRALVRQLLPGPVTILVTASRRARARFSPTIVGPRRTLGVRIPAHPVARELARRAGPITATSANLHGEPPARSIREARRRFGPKLDGWVDEGPRGSGKPSEMLDLTGDRPRWVSR